MIPQGIEVRGGFLSRKVIASVPRAQVQRISLVRRDLMSPEVPAALENWVHWILVAEAEREIPLALGNEGIAGQVDQVRRVAAAVLRLWPGIAWESRDEAGKVAVPPGIAQVSAPLP